MRRFFSSQNKEESKVLIPATSHKALQESIQLLTININAFFPLGNNKITVDEKIPTETELSALLKKALEINTDLKNFTIHLHNYFHKLTIAIADETINIVILKSHLNKLTKKITEMCPSTFPSESNLQKKPKKHLDIFVKETAGTTDVAQLLTPGGGKDEQNTGCFSCFGRR